MGALLVSSILTIGIALGPANSVFSMELYFTSISTVYLILARGYLVAPRKTVRPGTLLLTGNAYVHIVSGSYWIGVGAAALPALFNVQAFPAWMTLVLSILLWRLALIAQNGMEPEPWTGSPALKRC